MAPSVALAQCASKTSCNGNKRTHIALVLVLLFVAVAFYFVLSTQWCCLNARRQLKKNEEITLCKLHKLCVALKKRKIVVLLYTVQSVSYLLEFPKAKRLQNVS